MEFGAEFGAGPHMEDCGNSGLLVHPSHNTAPTKQGAQKKGHKFDNPPYLAFRV